MALGYRPTEQVVNMQSVEADDWRAELISYLKNLSQKVSRKLRYKALRHARGV